MNDRKQGIEKVNEELEQEGYDHGIAIATQAEIEAGAACGQLSIITEEDKGSEEYTHKEK